jgi:hypothetical protein
MLHGKEHRMIKKSPILFLLAIFLLSACGLAQPTPTPTAMPLPTNTPTLTPAPTSTSTPTPSPTPTLGPQYPASLSPADVEFLKAHADDPNVTWTVDADGVTTVEMRQPLNMTEDEEKAAINAECGLNCVYIRNDDKFDLYGVYTGETQMIIQPNGSTEVVTRMDFMVRGEIRTATLRWIFDTRNPVNDWLYERLGLQGDRPTLAEIARLFAAGNPASLRMRYGPANETDFYKTYIMNRFGPEYWAAVRTYIDSGFNPDWAVELIVVGV